MKAIFIELCETIIFNFSFSMYYTLGRILFSSLQHIMSAIISSASDRTYIELERFFHDFVTKSLCDIGKLCDGDFVSVG